MSQNEQDGIAEIEATQLALRESIEQTKGLAIKAESLLQKHKLTLQAAAEPRARADGSGGA